MPNPGQQNLSIFQEQPATSGQIFVDQQRNQMLAAILKALTDGLLPVPGQIPGTGTNDNADAGNVGEYISSTVLAGSAVGLTTATAANVTSISLTAGDWDVWGAVANTVGAGTTTSLVVGWISTTSATQPTSPNEGAYASDSRAVAANGVVTMPVGSKRISLASTTTVYLGVRADFAVNTMAAYGFIGARRRR